ncbi:stage V sporulation protein G [Desulfitobacterium sp. LBE]|uniref:SpoVG family protein n=1 Tax=Desulfitobacterium sp. LBE TaxID=884086 RepID=UPI00119A2055|nr:SpoVG family protein [Desulfitobacterium sp. LBE]TWH59305.1 stage V sporulation protein G [Desulfitobacterium sp. LBE]
MNIKAEIKKTFEDKGKLKAVANLVFEDGFVVKNVRLVEGVKGQFVSMPSHKKNDGNYIEVCHPISSKVREQIEKCVMEAYQNVMMASVANADKAE